jgi:N6-adenosine-specific RNA methylase IME4
MQLTVNPTLKAFIRPLSELEFSQLEQNVLRDGCREPLSIWEKDGKSILLDGHNRHAICTKHGVPFKTVSIKSVTLNDEKLPLDSVERAELWIGQNQNGRRNLDASDRAALGAQLVPAFAVEAARRQKEEAAKAGALGAQAGVLGGRPKQGEEKTPLVQKYTKGVSEPKVVQKSVQKEANKVANANKAAAQAAKLVGAAPTYVAAAAKAAGYDNKTQTFKKPEVLAKIGSGAGQTKIADIVKVQRQETQQTKLAAITKENATKLPEEKEYSVLYVDCPWRYDFAETDNRKIENQYPTMDVEDLKKFQVSFANDKTKPVGGIAAKDSVLFFWATAPKMVEAMEVIKAWGFEYKTQAIWDKEKMGMGYWFRGQHEILIVATKGKMPPPGEYARVSSVIRAPRGRHSEKPEVVYEIIEKMYPKAARVEIFARSPRTGWDSLGNQL